MRRDFPEEWRRFLLFFHRSDYDPKKIPEREDLQREGIIDSRAQPTAESYKLLDNFFRGHEK